MSTVKPRCIECGTGRQRNLRPIEGDEENFICFRCAMLHCNNKNIRKNIPHVRRYQYLNALQISDTYEFRRVNKNKKILRR